MGTSISSSGPKGGCPLLPPWLEDEEKKSKTPDAPQRRFSSARRALGKFVSTGDKENLGRALGHYSSTGMGGAKNAGRRLVSGASRGAALYNSLSAGGGPESLAQKLGLQPSELSGKSSREVADIISSKLCNLDGAQDREANRSAMSQALGEFIDNNPEADLSRLSEEASAEITKNFIAEDIFQRTCLDIGQAVHNNADSSREAISRLDEIRDFIKGSVNLAFREGSINLSSVQPSAVTQFLSKTTEAVFRIFESYIR